MTRFPIIALLIVMPTVTMAQAELPDQCGASAFQGLIGQSGEIADLLELEQPMRVIRPGTIVTRDYRVERINFNVDEADRISRIDCG